jgi:syntaxin 18
MAHDTTDVFRAFVYQKRNGLGNNSQLIKPARQSHPAPGDPQMDGAPPFMQAYMKEAYTIVSYYFPSFCYLFLRSLLAHGKLKQIASLTRMLAAVRRPYLDVHARIPPVTRQAARALDTTGVDTWADIKTLTNAERDQIDVQTRHILARCAERVHDMETLEKRVSFPPLSSFLV